MKPCRPPLTGLLAALLLAALTVAWPGRAQSVNQAGRSAGISPREEIHFGYSLKVLADVNEADGLAAVKVWMESFIGSRQLEVDVHCQVFSDRNVLAEALRAGEVDLVTMTATDFARLRPYLDTEQLMLSVSGEDALSEYLLMVHDDHPARTLADLHNTRLLVLNNLQTIVASDWLESCLGESGLPRAGEFFSSVEQSTKTSRVILPVFFGKADACLVSCRAYDTAVELNPQLGNAFRVIERSPRMVPGVTCFRAGYNGSMKNHILDTVEEMHLEPRGRQVFMLFKTDRVVLAPVLDLESTLRVLGIGEADDEP